jgi:serine/threonine protein phosphatase PrpC
MARSFGDFCLKNYGIISMPDVSYHRITEKDEFVVLATDGVSTNLHKHIGFCIFIELDIVKSYDDFCYIISGFLC